MKTLPSNALASARILFLTLLFSFEGVQAQDKAPKPFSSYIEADKNYKGDIGVVLPPKEIRVYLKKVEDAAKKNGEWFREYSEKFEEGVPLPYHENLGLTQKEYQKYIELWEKREFKSLQEVGLRFQKMGDKWGLKVTGKGARISLLRFNPATGSMTSPNGELKRIEDIDAPAESYYGAWKGVEWRFESESSLSKTKENFGIGKTADGKYGMLVYRLLDISVSNPGRVLFDQGLVIRFELK